MRGAPYNQPLAMAHLRKGCSALLAAVILASIFRISATTPVRAANTAGGVTLDAYGGLHPFAGLAPNTAGSPYRNGFDIAHAVVLRQDGSGGWELDGFGGLHAFGIAPAVSSPAYWNGWNIARAVVVTSKDQNGILDGRQGYLLDGFGGIHPWGGAPALSGSTYFGRDVARGLEIHYDATGQPDGGWTLDSRGRTLRFGAAPALPATTLPPAPIFQQLHGTAAAGYIVPKYGVITAYGSGVSPYWSGYTDWGASDLLRDIVLLDPTNPTPSAQPVSAAASATYQAWLRPHGGVTLDGWGGLHLFSGMVLDQTRSPYWASFDIARAVTVRTDASGGWILDAWGGIHNFGAAPPISTPAYWPGWFIARAMVVTTRDADGQLDGRQGYVMDGRGGLHPWGGAPALAGAPYTGGDDLQRGLEMHYALNGAPDGGWEMDRSGHLTAFGAAPPLTVPGLPNSPVLQQLHAVGNGGNALAKWGSIATYGSAYWGGYGDLAPGTSSATSSW